MMMIDQIYHLVDFKSLIDTVWNNVSMNMKID